MAVDEPVTLDTEEAGCHDPACIEQQLRTSAGTVPELSEAALCALMHTSDDCITYKCSAPVVSSMWRLQYFRLGKRYHDAGTAKLWLKAGSTLFPIELRK